MLPAQRSYCTPGRGRWECGEPRYPKTQGIRPILAMPVESVKCCRTQVKRQNLHRWENKDFRVQSLLCDLVREQALCFRMPQFP